MEQDVSRIADNIDRIISNANTPKLITIITQQGFSKHNTRLPESDALELMEIYDRNSIWYSVSYK